MNQTQREEFGAYLRALRVAQGLSQKAAASLAGISAPYLAQLERGQRNAPSRDILLSLAGVYATDEARLMEMAGYRADGGAKHYRTIDLQRLDWAFNTVCRDPDFALGTRMALKATPEVKAWVIELYLKTRQRQLLTDEELNALKETIAYDETDNDTRDPTR